MNCSQTTKWRTLSEFSKKEGAPCHNQFRPIYLSRQVGEESKKFGQTFSSWYTHFHPGYPWPNTLMMPFELAFQSDVTVAATVPEKLTSSNFLWCCLP